MSTHFEHQALVFQGTNAGPFVTATPEQYDQLLAWQDAGWEMFSVTTLSNGHLFMAFKRPAQEPPSPPAHWGTYA